MRFPLLTLLLGAALLPACGDAEPTSETRMVVFGVDGLDPEMLQERIDRGMLPNFAKLAGSGTFQPLQTSWPPQSPVSWSNFITGCNPGKHGLFDFIHVDYSNYGVLNSMAVSEPVDFEISLAGYKIPVLGGDQDLTRAFPAFWEVMSDAGVPVYVHRMPANYPMRDTKAVTFPDMGAPDLAGAASGKAFLWSEDPSRSDRDSDSYYIRNVSVNRMALDMGGGKGIVKIPLTIYGPEDTAKDLDSEHDQISDLDRERRQAETAGNTARVTEIGDQIAGLNRTIKEEMEVSTPFDAFLDYTGADVQLTVEMGDSFGMAGVGDWTDWVKVEFEVLGGMMTLSGYTRFLFKSAEPFELYAAPVQVDPWNQAMPVSTPEDAATNLADAIGPYYTQGFPDAYKAYKADLLDTGDFVSQSDTVFDERLNMMDYAMDELADSGGLLFFYTGSLDLRSHMLWWAQDEKHPYQDVKGTIEDELYPQYSQQIDRVYKQVDDMLGRLMERIETMEGDGSVVELVVMSDHGFAPFRRRMNINDWLVQEGYLVLKDGETTGSISAMGHLDNGEIDWDSSIVDWSKSKAYCIGFNGILINRTDREAQGIVKSEAVNPLLDDIRDKLLSMRDEDGTQVFTRVLKATEVFSGDRLHYAPDLQLGFNVGYGGSDPAATGEVTGGAVLEDNTSRWSGSHLMDPELVRGTIIVRSGANLSKDPALEDITATLYNQFGVTPPDGMDGKPLF
jgi:predicted AlkP superfamily phosphohydrolase/phosphomutase